MNIIYEDEYGVDIYLDTIGTFIPVVGDTVIIDYEEWKVKSRRFDPIYQSAIISLTQTIFRQPVAEQVDNGRLTQMNNAIVRIDKRQDASEKKNRALNEQVSKFRKNLNQRSTQERKDND